MFFMEDPTKAQNLLEGRINLTLCNVLPSVGCVMEVIRGLQLTLCNVLPSVGCVIGVTKEFDLTLCNVLRSM